MNHPPRDQTRRYDVGKRAIDIIASLVGLLLTAPLQAGIAVLVARALGRPVLFRQQRPGRDGKPFVLFKFRTMREADEARDLITDLQRLTPLGARLRSASLDELPTLWNVLRGDMSLVGPRPLLMRYLDRYTPEQTRRHHVRPGITGLAQVSGRNALTWDQKFAADLDYVRRRNFALDLRILALTIRAVLRRDGISADGEATMSEFLGSTDAST